MTIGLKAKRQNHHYVYDLQIPHSGSLHEAENFLNLVLPILPDATYESFINIAPVPKYNLSVKLIPELCIVMHMCPSGINSQQKEWPPEYWAELARDCVSAGYTVVFTGSSANEIKTCLLEHFAIENIHKIQTTLAHLRM